VKNWFVNNKREIVLISIVLGVFLLLLLIATKAFTINGTDYNDMIQNSVIVSLGDFQVKWYALFIVFGLVSAAIIQINEAKKLKLNPNYIYDGLLIIAPLAILGLRAFYLATDDVKGNFFSEFLNFQDGGLAIFGAIIVALVGALIYTKIRKLSFFAFADIIVPGLLIGQVIGRWGNYMNGEVTGRVIEGMSAPTWLFIFNNFGEGTAVFHPFFLYESIWNFIGLVLIFTLRRKKFVHIGDIFFFYLIWYGIGRGVMEPLRQPEYQLGIWSLLFAIISICVGIVGILTKYIVNRKTPLSRYSQFEFSPMPQKNKTKPTQEVDPEEFMKSDDYPKWLEEQEQFASKQASTETESKAEDDSIETKTP
jgi:phosphatidylglycerol:prolipoprotein diacylglycerol transferase